MNFLGIGPGEIFLILIVLLVVVGPQRLPDFARQAGRMLVRVRNWVQTSPDAAMVLRARQELEQELASIRTSLMEVQNVRDEVLGAAKQLEESVNTIASNAKLEVQNVRDEVLGATKQLEASVNTIASNTKTDLNNVINPPTSIPQTDQAANVQATPGQVDDAPVESPYDQVPAEIRVEIPNLVPETAAEVVERVEIPNLAPETAAEVVEAAHSDATAPGLTPSEAAELNLRLQAVMADLWALQEQLRQRGLLDADWQPPSFTMRLPDGTPTPPNGRIEEVP